MNATLDGFKTVLVGVAALGVGLYFIGQGENDRGTELLFLGLGLLGLAHKGARTEQVVQQIKDAVAPSPPTP